MASSEFSKINNDTELRTKVRRHRSLDLRSANIIRKTMQHETNYANCTDSSAVLEHRALVEKMCDEFEKMNGGSEYRKFLISRLDPYIIDMKMDSARPIVCDGCSSIVAISGCITCDSCHSFYCHNNCRNIGQPGIMSTNQCFLCGPSRNMCNKCQLRSRKCRVCYKSICDECTENNPDQVKICKGAIECINHAKSKRMKCPKICRKKSLIRKLL